MASPQTTLQFSSPSDSLPTLNAHLLPCTINFSGPAPSAGRYFSVAQESTGALPSDRSVLTSSFRGRRLRGAELQLSARTTAPHPEGESEHSSSRLTVAVLRNDAEESGAGNEDGQGGVWREAAKVERLVYWNHDDEPQESVDAVAQSVRWARIAEALHGHIGEDEMD